MNKALYDAQLDIFIRETLKKVDEHFQPFDWSEVEVLLKHEPRAIPVQVSKKTMLVAAAAAGILILSVIIFQISQHYSSMPDEAEPVIDSTENTFNLLDTASTVIRDSAAILKANTSKADSIALVIEKRKADSLQAIAAEAMNEKYIAPVINTVPKKDRRKKTDTTQKSSADTISLKKDPGTINIDTPPEPPALEIIREIPAAPDTTNKSQAPNNTKKKKSKSRKSVPPTAETKSDSLNQQ